MNVAILGATGAVGREMMKILAERSFSRGGTAAAGLPPAPPGKAALAGAGATVQPAGEVGAFEGMVVVLGAAGERHRQALRPGHR